MIEAISEKLSCRRLIKSSSATNRTAAFLVANAYVAVAFVAEDLPLRSVGNRIVGGAKSSSISELSVLKRLNEINRCFIACVDVKI